jgi:hypothetical protein
MGIFRIIIIIFFLKQEPGRALRMGLTTHKLLFRTLRVPAEAINRKQVAPSKLVSKMNLRGFLFSADSQQMNTLFLYLSIGANLKLQRR